MSTSPLFSLVTGLAQLAWPVFSALLIVAAVFFVRADRRHPAFCFLVGSIIQFLIAMWSLMAMGPLAQLIGIDLIQGDSAAIQKYFAIQAGVGFVGQGLIAYGLLILGIMYFRKTQLPQFDDKPPAR